jgi:hypothetical protein
MEFGIIEEKNIITIFEYCDKKRATWVLNRINTIDIKRPIDPIHKTKIKEYCKLVIKSKNGKVEKNYSNDGMGRTNIKSSQYGYQNMIREVRGLLTCNDYYDLDIINCIPTILNQYCILNEIKCQMLTKYVNERDKIFKDFMESTKLEKSIIKQDIFITLIFGDKIKDEIFEKLNKKQQEYIQKFQSEMTKIKKIVEKKNPNKIVEYTKEQQEKKNKDFNFYGSLIAYLVYHLENKIILTALTHLKKNKYEIGALCFDGLLVRNTMNLTERNIVDLENEIFKQTNYKIKFSIKKPELPFEIPNEELDDDNTTDELTAQYLEIKKEVEQKYFFLLKPPSIGYFDKEKRLVLTKWSDMKGLVLKPYNFKYEISSGKTRTYDFADAWNEDKKRLAYDNIIFEPHQENNDNSLNLFTGFELEQFAPTDKSINEILEFFKYVLQDGYDYLLDWFAFIVQKKTRTEQCPVLYSDEHGIGKSTIINTFELLLGLKYCTSIKKIEDLSKEFNGTLENKFLCYANEINAKKKDIYEDLKDTLTTTYLEVNKKGIEMYRIAHYCNYIFSTNTYNPVKIEKNDRRMAIVECSEVKQTDEYYININNLLKDKEIQINLFHFFKNRNLPLKIKLYEGEHKKDLQNIYIPSPIKYLYKNMYKLRYEFEILKSSELYLNIKTFEKNNNYTDCSSNKDMTLKLKKFGIVPKVEKSGTLFHFNSQEFYDILKKNNKALFDENYDED